MITLKIIGLIGKAIFAITKTADMKTVRLDEKDKEIEILNKFITDQNAEIERLQDLTVSLDTKCSIAQLTIGQKENEIERLKAEVSGLKVKIETSFVATLESTEQPPADEPKVRGGTHGCARDCDDCEYSMEKGIYQCNHWGDRAKKTSAPVDPPADKWAGFVPRVSNHGKDCGMRCRSAYRDGDGWQCDRYDKKIPSGFETRLPECIAEYGLQPGEVTQCKDAEIDEVTP